MKLVIYFLAAVTDALEAKQSRMAMEIRVSFPFFGQLGPFLNYRPA